MKNLNYLLILLASLSLITKGVTASNGEVSEPMVSTKMGVSDNIRNLSTQICGYYTSDASKVAENVKRSVINHMKKYDNIANPTPTQMVRFLNRNKHYMTCGDDNAGYMVESFRHRAHYQLFNVFMFDHLLLDDESLYIDINAVSFTGGESGKAPELTLDYMYRESTNLENARGMQNEIKDLIEFFEGDLNGKRYHELIEQEKQAVRDSRK